MLNAHGHSARTCPNPVEPVGECGGADCRPVCDCAVYFNPALHSVHAPGCAMFTGHAITKEEAAGFGKGPGCEPAKEVEMKMAMATLTDEQYAAEMARCDCPKGGPATVEQPNPSVVAHSPNCAVNATCHCDSSSGTHRIGSIATCIHAVELKTPSYTSRIPEIQRTEVVSCLIQPGRMTIEDIATRWPFLLEV